MRHNAAGRKLGRTTSHRLALFRNQLSSLVAQERIVTTISKAKELRPLAERMITQGKRGTVHARRLVARWIQSRDLVKKLFDDIAPRFAERPGGYLRIVKLGPRQGDGAEMAVLQFVDFEIKKGASKAGESKPKGRKSGAQRGKSAAAPETAEAGTEEKPEKKAKKAAKPRSAAQSPAKRTAAPAGMKPKSKPRTGSQAAKKSSSPKKTGGS
jgi:large subunit ribosomal protein L17